MANPVSKKRKKIQVGKTTFEFGVTIRDEPLVSQDISVTTPQGHTMVLPAKDLFQFVAEAFVAPMRRAAEEEALKDGNFTGVLLHKI